MGWVCRFTGWKFPGDFGCTASCLARRTHTAVALAVLLSLVPFSSSDAHVAVSPGWCAQHFGNDLQWVTENKKITGPPYEPYVLQLSGDPSPNDLLYGVFGCLLKQ